MDRPSVEFHTISASVAAEIIERDPFLLCELVRGAYRAFGSGRAINPHSQFLTFTEIEPDSPNRIIALPACTYADHPVAGIKWVASFPRNAKMGLPRASAVLILNDVRTGVPFACLEGSVISAARTAASAVIGAEILCGTRRTVASIGFVGNGLIASEIWSLLIECGWRFNDIHLYDEDPQKSLAFSAAISQAGNRSVHRHPSHSDLLKVSDLIVLATTASSPHILDLDFLSRRPWILNISLRDLSPHIILMSDNVVDDVDHCLRAQTSLHLAEQASGSRKFVSANVYDCLRSDRPIEWRSKPPKAAIFSPFGLGVLDVSLGLHVYRTAAEEGTMTPVKDFFPLLTVLEACNE